MSKKKCGWSMLPEGGFLPYGRHLVDEEDIAAVVEVLRSDWLTTGPLVAQFEESVARFCGAHHGVAVSSGTAALHAAMHAIGIGPGDEVIVPAITFAATANCVVYQGGKPVFADVEPDTLLVDPECVEELITPSTRAIIAMDYAGQPCDYDSLRDITRRHGLKLIADACHSLGASYKGKPVGRLADLTMLSFHPVKHITTGEGGMVVTDNADLTKRMRCFRNHGISIDHRQRELQGTWFYEVIDLGYNYRLSDFQCALGMSQLRKLPTFLGRRRDIARQFNHELAALVRVKPLVTRTGVDHAYHLYVVRLGDGNLRAEVFKHLRGQGVGVNVHYLPVYLHPFYREKFGHEPGLCPMAEAAYNQIISLPIWPGMNSVQVTSISEQLLRITQGQKD